ncbi:MAG: DUF512 domain-containing protein [Ruminococcaceae bacterium]|nr:DUF512 domain-containing protein [Oscillospiraceae bacterium]
MLVVTISGVAEGSIAQRQGIKAGDMLLEINSNPIRDVLDYRFYLTEKRVKLLLKRDGEEYTLSFTKGEYTDIGLEFDTYLMDKKCSCTNKCIFCFIDQNPPGMRETVYFKDDDTRLSFLMGNYVTLTNVSYNELDRIIKMRLSPVNVSVHTTDPELRCMMLNNRFAGDVLQKLKYLCDGGISLNCQIVLCKGINDKESLKRTLADLYELGDSVESVAVVPAGLTAYRSGLYPIEPYDKISAGEVIDITDSFAKKALEERMTRFVFCSDEFYLKAQRKIPDGDFYEGYPQLDNGVGALALMDEELEDALCDAGEGYGGSVTLFTGESAYESMRSWVEKIKARTDAKGSFEVICAKNRFFGGEVTVAGLLTGSDIIAAAKGVELGDRVILPARMLRSQGDQFLDSMTTEELEERLNRKIIFTDSARELVDALTVRKE